MSALVLIAGLAGMPPENHPERAGAFALLLDHAESFLAAGGVLTLGDWASLGVEERAAFATAAARLRAQQTAAAGLASRDELGAAEVLAPVDGGRARRRVILERAAKAAGGGA